MPIEKLTHSTKSRNAGRIVRAKPLLKPKDIRALRTRPQIANRLRNLAMFNLAIEKLRPD